MTLGELAKHEGSMEHQALKAWTGQDTVLLLDDKHQAFRDGFRAAYSLWLAALEDLKDQLDV